MSSQTSKAVSKYAIEPRRLFLILLALSLTLSLDQATKWAAKSSLIYAGRLSYLGDTVRLQYVENTGAFLSLGASLPPQYRFWVFTVAVSVMLAGVGLLMFVKKTTPLSVFALTLLVGGGVGNLIDRITYGRVVDFMNLGIGDLRTGIFNIADIAIMAGVFILTFESLQKPSVQGKPKN